MTPRRIYNHLRGRKLRNQTPLLLIVKYCVGGFVCLKLFEKTFWKGLGYQMKLTDPEVWIIPYLTRYYQLPHEILIGLGQNK